MKKLVTILLIFIIAFMFVSCDNNFIKINNAIVYEIIEGDNVVVLRDGEEELAYKGMRLKVGDVIKTDEASKVYIRIDDTKNILLEYDTSMEITEHSNGKLYLTLLSGEFFFDVTEPLTDDEEITFNMSSTSMSIRGTSGGGKLTSGDGKFMIYTGLGYIENVNSATSEVTTLNLYPSTKIEFSSENEIQVEMVSVEDIPDVLKTYVAGNEEYQEELNEEGWDTSNSEYAPPENVISSNEANRIGWRENIDGTWYFSLEDYNNNIGPTYYTDYPSKDSLSVSNVTYNGYNQKAVINGFDSETMTASNDVHYDAGSYNIVVTPKYKWSDGTKDQVTLSWTIYKKNVSVKAKDASVVKGSTESLEAEVSGACNGDVIYYEIPYSSEQIGTYTITPVISGNYSNYNISVISGTLIVNDLPILNVEIEGYTGEYDGEAHGGTITILDKLAEDPTITYRLNSYDSDPIDDPTFTDAGVYTIYVTIEHPSYRTIYSSYDVEITRKYVRIVPSVNNDFTEFTLSLDPDDVSASDLGEYTIIDANQQPYIIPTGLDTVTYRLRVNFTGIYSDNYIYHLYDLEVQVNTNGVIAGTQNEISYLVVNQIC